MMTFHCGGMTFSIVGCYACIKSVMCLEAAATAVISCSNILVAQCTCKAEDLHHKANKCWDSDHTGRVAVPSFRKCAT